MEYDICLKILRLLKKSALQFQIGFLFYSTFSLNLRFTELNKVPSVPQAHCARCRIWTHEFCDMSFGPQNMPVIFAFTTFESAGSFPLTL